jgi:hypothetical protein
MSADNRLDVVLYARRGLPPSASLRTALLGSVVGRFTVRVVARQTNGTRVTSVRTYDGCGQTAPKTKRRKRR